MFDSVRQPTIIMRNDVMPNSTSTHVSFVYQCACAYVLYLICDAFRDKFDRNKSVTFMVAEGGSSLPVTIVSSNCAAMAKRAASLSKDDQPRPGQVDTSVPPAPTEVSPMNSGPDDGTATRARVDVFPILAATPDEKIMDMKDHMVNMHNQFSQAIAHI